MSHISICVHCLFYQWELLRRVWLCLLTPPSGICYTLIRSPLSLLLPAEQSQLSQALLVYQMLQAFTSLHGRSWGLLQYAQVSL